MNFTINGFEVFLRTIPLMSVTHAGFISIKDYKISKGILLWCNISYNSSLFFFFVIPGNPSVCLFCFVSLFVTGKFFGYFSCPIKSPSWAAVSLAVTCYHILTTSFSGHYIYIYIFLNPGNNW